VPLHKKLKRGTLRGILRDADLSVDELRERSPSLIRSQRPSALLDSSTSPSWRAAWAVPGRIAA
jgi:hypothetical protein